MPFSQDLYNPVPQQEATTQAPNDYFSVRANPEEFGAQIGEAAQGLGRQIQESSKDLSQNVLQYQGLLNEHEANAADMNLAVQGGQVYDKYKQMEGMAAANAKDQAVQDYLAVNEKIRSSISNPAAQRAYDQLATRRLSFTIQDMNSYAADQAKKAIKGGFSDSMNLALDQTSRYSVASDSTQFGFQLGTIYHNLNALFTDPQTGKYAGYDVKQNQDGTLSFDTNTPEGKIAQADYDTVANTYISKAWDNRANALAFGDGTNPGNITNAMEFITQNRSKIPAVEFQKLMKDFHGPYTSELARSGAEDIIGSARQSWVNSVANPGTETNVPNNLGNVKNKDNTAFLNPRTPTDGVIATVNNLRGGLYKGKTLDQIAGTWTGEPNKASGWADAVSKASGIPRNSVPNLDDPKVVSALVKGINVAEKSQKDRSLFNDDVISSGVKSAFAGNKAQLADHPSGSSYIPFADYLGAHSSELIQQARDHAAHLGYDVTVQDDVAARTAARISQEITQRNQVTRAYQDAIISKVTDDTRPITSISALDYSPDPELKQQWVQLQADNPYAAQTVKNIVAANAKGASRTYGTDFYNHYAKVIEGQEDPETLADYVGDDSAPISASGWKQLSRARQDSETPEGKAFAQDEKNFLDGIRKSMTSTVPGLQTQDLDKVFEGNLPLIFQRIQAGKNNGKTSAELFDPKSKDYVGNGLRYPSLAEIKKAQQDAALRALGAGGFKHLDDMDAKAGVTELQRRVKAGQASRQEALDYIVKRGWAKPAVQAPSVPLPQ